MKKILVLLCILSFSIVNAQVGVSFVDSLKQELRKTYSDSTRSLILAELAYRYYTVPDSHYSIAQRSLALAEKINFEKGIAAAKYSFGAYYCNLSDYINALNYLDEALTIEKKYGSKKQIARIYLSLGAISGDMGDYKKALKNSKIGLNLFKQIGDDDGMIWTLNNIGYLYLKTRNYDSSELYLKESLHLAKKNVSSQAAYSSLGSLAELYAAKNDFKKSKYYLWESIRLNDGRDLRTQADNYIQLAKVYQKTGDLHNAFSAANKALELAKGSCALIREKTAYELLSQLYSNEGDHLKALDCLKKSIVVNDSIFSMEKNKQEENLSSRLERQQKEAQIKILQQDNELRMAHLQLQKDEISRKNFYLIGVIIALLFLASLLFVIYRQTLSRKKYINVIEKKNSEIQLQANELNELNQKLISLNENLEHQAEERANKIIEQNYKIDEYAFINSHRLRAPVATILGIKNLIDAHYVDEEEQKKLIEQVLFEVNKIDLIVREINKIIE